MKGLRSVVLLGVVACVVMAQPMSRLRAGTYYINGDTYAAIAYSPETGKYGYSYGYGSRWAAEAEALKNCEAKDAKIVTWVNNGFCALATGDDKGCYGIGYSWGDGATNTYAKNRALEECAKRTTKGKIVVCVCSMGWVSK